MAKLSNTAKRTTVAVHIQIKAAPGTEAKYLALQALATDPAVWVGAVKLAMAATLVAAYQDRFWAAQEMMTSMESAEGAFPTPKQTTGEFVRQKDKVRDLEKQHGELIIAGKIDEANKISMQLQHMNKVSRGRITNTNSIKNMLYQAGAGRAAFMAGVDQVWSAMSLIEQAGGAGNGVTLGAGNLGRLDLIETPSARIWKGQTHSEYKILWRHLEYGTGYYANPRVHEDGEYKGPDGSWYTGLNKSGVHVLGSRGGHFFRTVTGIAYDDGGAFQAAVGVALQEALRGSL